MNDKIAMPDKNNNRENDTFVDEISSIGMSLRSSGSASSGEFRSILKMHLISNNLLDITCIFI